MAEEVIDIAGDAAPSGGGGGSMLLTILVGVNLLITVAVVAMVFLGIGPFAPQPAAGTEVVVEAEPLPPPMYESMDKPVIASVPAGDRTKYLQLVVQFMTRSDQTVLDIRTHMPAIVDAIYIQLSEYDHETLQTGEGRERLRQAILELSQSILERHTGEPGVEEVLFTTYVFQ
ncbi:MAG: flagellar basal body-associated FliL family protein [Xanthomonadales bacterium]|nr:flagellar basal body-associated FliL family protein [Xanthomonadales bacterium]